MDKNGELNRFNKARSNFMRELKAQQRFRQMQTTLLIMAVLIEILLAVILLKLFISLGML